MMLVHKEKKSDMTQVTRLQKEKQIQYKRFSITKREAKTLLLDTHIKKKPRHDTRYLFTKREAQSIQKILEYKQEQPSKNKRDSNIKKDKPRHIKTYSYTKDRNPANKTDTRKQREANT